MEGNYFSICHVFCFLFIVIDVEGAGRGAIAREDLKVGDTALEIPTSLIICEELVQKTDMVCFIT